MNQSKKNLIKLSNIYYPTLAERMMQGMRKVL